MVRKQKQQRMNNSKTTTATTLSNKNMRKTTKWQNRVVVLKKNSSKRRRKDKKTRETEKKVCKPPNKPAVSIVHIPTLSVCYPTNPSPHRCTPAGPVCLPVCMSVRPSVRPPSPLSQRRNGLVHQGLLVIPRAALRPSPSRLHQCIPP